MQNVKELTFWEKFSFWLTGFGSNMGFRMVGTYLVFFYTDIFGISPAVVGSIMLVSRLWDAANDPFMGNIVDRTNSKWGRYRPYQFIGAIITGISLMLLFASPDLSPSGKVIYAYFAYILFSTANTVVQIPTNAMVPELTSNQHERTSVMAGKQWLGMMAGLLITTATKPFVDLMAFGGTQAQGWFRVAVIYGILLMVAYIICTSVATKKVENKRKASKVPEKKITMKQYFNAIKTNKPLLLLTIAFATDLMAFSTAMSSNIFFFKYNVQNMAIFPTYMFAVGIVPIATIPLVPFLSRKFGKKNVMLYGSLINVFIIGSLYLVDFSNITMLFVISVASAAVMGVTGSMGWSMMTDCGTYAEWKTGVKAYGSISAAVTFTNKLGRALGGFLVGSILAYTGYIANQPATPAVQQGILFLRAAMPAIGSICSVIAMIFYPITNESFNQMIEDIEARKEKKAC